MGKLAIVRFAVVLFLLVASCRLSAQSPIKIACVGNSITYGAGMVNREKNAYPAQLQAMLGGDYYEVRNFGVNGTTLLKKGDHPYWNTNQYKNALGYNADIVFIKLGTNDSKQQNRVYLADFEADYKSLISSFQEVNENVRIVLLLPVPSFLEDTTSIWDPVIKGKITPLTQKVAYDAGVEVIDLYQLFVGQPGLFPDKIHPSSNGATVIAKRVYEAVVQKTETGFDIQEKLGLTEIKKSSFHGFEQMDFEYNGVACKIVKPKRIAPKKPWIWRARFWGHEPQTDIALLERGFHVVYCDVSNLYGAPEAVTRWNNFYDLMRQGGLSEKAALEGMSRGGLIVYNWAVENQEKVACIYADAPVLDGKSWPGGFGKGKGSKGDWERFMKVYGLESQESIDAFAGNPIHKTEAIAKAGFSMIHVCGEADKVVPVDENSRIFEQKIKESGGEINVIYKEGVDHHPHSLKNPTPIVDFILRVTDNKINFATIAAPGAEYRSAAGWKEGKDWWAQMEDIDSLCRNSGKIDLLLIGNSITQGWGGSRTLTTYKPGKEAADTYFKKLKWISAGISGDRTQHIAWRLQNGHYEACKPKFVVLAIGVNNFGDNTAEEIAKGIEMDLTIIEAKFPKSAILLLGPLPTGLDKDSNQRKKYNEVHQLIAGLGENKKVNYSNLIELFSNEDGSLSLDYYGNDGIHLKPDGYKVWAKYIREQMKNIK
ncbi:GDSL-type esterase/lipase family protein [Reichenbachiella sp. MALMAid0571]|uniref:GDSL-type esterase/lipase family protein n=1 Tax=Reichenbachiella sp. MALMAid0571 TaxID=3143939 RepID=UPI0032DE9C8D